MKLLIADDHRLMVEGIRRALEPAEDIEIVGEASTGSQVLPLVRRLHPDVVLLDMRMPHMDGLLCLDAIRKNCPKVKVIVLSVFSDPEHIQAAFRFELSKVTVPAIRERMVSMLMNVSADLAKAVAEGLGIGEVEPMPRVLARTPRPEVRQSAALSLLAHPGNDEMLLAFARSAQDMVMEELVQ